MGVSSIPQGCALCAKGSNNQEWIMFSFWRSCGRMVRKRIRTRYFVISSKKRSHAEPVQDIQLTHLAPVKQYDDPMLAKCHLGAYESLNRLCMAQLKLFLAGRQRGKSFRFLWVRMHAYLHMNTLPWHLICLSVSAASFVHSVAGNCRKV